MTGFPFNFKGEIPFHCIHIPHFLDPICRQTLSCFHPCRCSLTKLYQTLCDTRDCSISWSLRKLMSIELVMPSNRLILCCPLLLFPSVFPSIRVFSSELALGIRWSKYWGFSFSISPSNKYSGLISFRMDWFGLLAVQGTLKHHNLKASIFQCQTSLWSNSHTSVHDYWKKQSFDYTDLCWQSEVSALITLSMFVIAFLPRNKHLLIIMMYS